MTEKTKRKAQKECIWCDVKNENGCMLRPVKNPATGSFMGYIACEVIDKCPKWEKAKLKAQKEGVWSDLGNESGYIDFDAKKVKSNIETMILKKDKEEKDGYYKSRLQDLFEKNSEPKPLQIDEVAYAYFNQVRVNSWNILSNDYAGHKVGALYAFVLKLIEEHITESVNPVLKHSVEDMKNSCSYSNGLVFQGFRDLREGK